MIKCLAYGLGSEEIRYIDDTLYALCVKEVKTRDDLNRIRTLKYLASLPTLNAPDGEASDIFKDVFNIRPHGFEFGALEKGLINIMKED